MDFPGDASVKETAANGGDLRDISLITGLGRSLGGGHGNQLQYSCLENPMDRGAWQAMVHRVTKSWTPLEPLSTQHTQVRIASSSSSSFFFFTNI